MKCWQTSAGRGSVIKPSSCLLFFLVVCVAFAQEPTFRSQSNVVIVPALVRDVTGHAIYGLHAADFVIEDDGAEQAVQLDESAESVPVSLMIAVQCGRRAKREFGRIGGLASMLDPVLSQPDNEAALLFFDSKLNLASDFTNNADLIQGDLRNFRSGDGGAAILDAVAYSARLLARREEGRQRVLLLISETRDHGSHFAQLEDVVRLVGANNVSVYALPFSPYISQQLDAARGANEDEWHVNVDIIEKLAAARQAMRKNTPKALTAMTGGEYELFATRNGFETRIMDFSNHLHNRYVLSFEPRNPKPGLHQIRVRLKEPGTATVLARSSYWAAAPTQQ